MNRQTIDIAERAVLQIYAVGRYTDGAAYEVRVQAERACRLARAVADGTDTGNKAMLRAPMNAAIDRIRELADGGSNTAEQAYRILARLVQWTDTGWARLAQAVNMN